MVKLSNAHIIIEAAVANELFGDAGRASWVYYPQRNNLIIAQSTDELFKSLHKTSTTILKHRNDKGDRSLDILSLIIDHDIDTTSRDLEYKVDKQMNVLNVTI